MDCTSRTLPNYGNAVNVGEVQVQKQETTVAPTAESVSMKGDSQCYTVNVFNFNGNSHGSVPSRMPDTDLATWLQSHLMIKDPNEPVVWSTAARDFVSVEEEKQQMKQLEDQWRRTVTFLEKLDDAISGASLKPRKKTTNAEDQPSDQTTDEEVEGAVLDELKRSISLHKHKYRNLTSTSRNLCDIKDSVNPFFRWLKSLPDQHRISVCLAIRSILRAVADEEMMDETVVEMLAIVFRDIGSGYNEYLRAIETSRLTTSMARDTIEIFESLTNILVLLLKYCSEELPETQEGRINTELAHIKERLLSADNTARNGERPTRPPFLPRQDHSTDHSGYGGYILGNVMRELHHLLEHQVCRDVETSVGPPRPPANHRPAGLTMRALFKYVDFDPSEAAANLAKAIRPALSKEAMRELAAFTHRTDYQTWLKDRSRSSALLVHGMSQKPVAVSSLSYLCAQIEKHYADDEDVIVLFSFCGIQAVSCSSRERYNATNLVCQMIGQLLSDERAAAAYARDPVKRQWAEGIKQKDFKTLLDVLVLLIKCRTVVYCLIDSITVIESGRLRENTETLIEQLLGVLRKQQRKSKRERVSDSLVLKLLVTDGGRSLYVHDLFKRREIMNVGDGGLCGKHEGLKF